MVSRIPYPHIVNQDFRRQRTLWAPGGRWCLRCVAVMVIRGYAVPILCVLFVLVPPIKYLWQRVQQRASGE